MTITRKLFEPVRRFFLRAVAGNDFSEKHVIDVRIRELVEARISSSYSLLVQAVDTRDEKAALLTAAKLVEAVETATEIVNDWKRRQKANQRQEQGTARTKRAAGRS